MIETSHTTEVVILSWCGLYIISWKEAVCPSHLRISGVPRLSEGSRVFDLQKASLLLERGLEQPLLCKSVELRARPSTSHNDYLSSSCKLTSSLGLQFCALGGSPFLPVFGSKQPVSQGPQLISFFSPFTGWHHVLPISWEQAH